MFNTGDAVTIVRADRNYPMARLGMRGVIRVAYKPYPYIPGGGLIGVEWEEFVRGHDLDGALPYSRAGYYVPPDMLRLARPLTEFEQSLYSYINRELKA